MLQSLVPKVGEQNKERICKLEKMRKVKEIEKIERMGKKKKAIREIK